MSTDEDRFMKRALELAHKAAQEGEVPVGCVIVDPESQSIIAEGYNAPIKLNDPTAHAEIVALRQAGQALGNYRLFGLDLYTTLEPCTMCAGAIANARIRRVIYASEDIKGGAVSNGVRFFEQPTCHWHPEVITGPLGEESSELLRSFFQVRRQKNTRPKIQDD